MEKFRTSIDGFDEVTGGGIPQSRISLIAGGAGCGKTLFMLTAVSGGAAENGVPAVFLSFEERPEDIIENANSIGLDLNPLLDSGLLHIEYIKRPAETVDEAGDYSLEGLLMRIDVALKRTDARVLAIDTIETLFAMFADQRVIRQELVRIFDWLKARGVTTLISGERGDGQLTRHGLEEYISDCVVALDQRIINNVSTRRLRIVKYRGSRHGTNELPFLIDSTGITVLPLTSAVLDHPVSTEQVTTGIDKLDVALSGGIRRGSSVLVSGASGTGKTLLGVSFLAAACRRGEKAVLLSFEESPDELIHNSVVVGPDLRAAYEAKRLVIQSARPTLFGLEEHLVVAFRLVETVQPRVVVVDPLSSLLAAGERIDVQHTVVRLIDFLKRKQITTLLTAEDQTKETSETGLNISSIIDTWIRLEWDRTNVSFQRRLSIVKKRGTGHARSYLPFEIGSDGFKLEETHDG